MDNLQINRAEEPATLPTFTSERVEQLVKHVLVSRFQGEPMRQDIVRRGNRLNFCCPYCGDSNDPRKKRGNMYTNWLSFKCYNGGCEKYTDLEWFLRNFDQIHRLSDQELTALKIAIKDHKENFSQEKQQRYEANLQLLVDANWDRLLVKRSDFMSKMRLWDVHETSPQGVYLTKRKQVVDGKFAWDNYRKRLFLLNLDQTGNYVFSVQVMQMGPNKKPGEKYKTYPIDKVHEFFMKSPAGLQEYAENYASLSTLFGILTINIYQTVTIFEGPMDHFLYPNSVATCGIANDWPLDIDNKRWFQDNDDAGRKLAIEKLADGEPVFMWKKALEEQPHLWGNKRKDYNDIFLNAIINGKNAGTLDQYFSQHKHDGIYL